MHRLYKHFSSPHFVIALLVTTVCAWAGDRSSQSVHPLPPDVVRQTNGVYLVENHSTAGMVWHLTGQRGATVVHLDAHDDCRFVADDKLERLTPLWKTDDTDEIFRLSDLSYVSGFKVRPEETLFDLGNFIYPCMADGTVSLFIWVVPDLSLNDGSRARLKGHLVSALRLEAPPFTDHEDGSFSFPLLKGKMVVTTLTTMPILPPGAILDLDVDFFAFPRALTDIHLEGDLQWDPESVCERLAEIAPNPSLTTISASVYGGYLPLMFRFLADACFDRLVSGTYPAYARRHLETVLAMRRTAAAVPLPPAPTDAIYEPAYQHLAGLLKLIECKPTEAFAHMEKASSLSPVFRKAWLDSAEALRYMGDLEAAGESIRRFERDTGHATTESQTERVHLLRLLDRFDEAERMARELTDWNPDPHLLLLHGGVLAQMKRYAEASEAYRRVIAVHPQDHLAAYNLAYVCEQQGHIDEAIAYYRTAVALRDDLAAAHENLGYLLMRQREFTDAETHLRRAIEVNPGKATAWGNLGFVLLETGRPADAVSCFQKAVEIAPNLTKAREGLAAALKATTRATAREVAPR